MAAIITDQIRILNAKNFVAGVSTNINAYYAFVGLPNPTTLQSDWDSAPPSPVDSFSDSNDYYDTMIAVKKITPADVKQIVQKNQWSSGTTYDYYRHDYSITNPPKNSGGTTLYTANYFIVNSDYRVYICLQNGTTPETPDGKPSLDEPTFTDLEPRIAGTSGDGYLWKYLYSIKPADLIKFDSTDFMPVPENWETNSTDSAIRNNAVDGGIKVVVIKNRGTGIGTANQTYTRVPIKGDGFNAECTVVVNNDQQIESVTISNEGYGYTYGNVDLAGGSVPTPTASPTLDVIIPPPGGHGKDIYRELGAFNVLCYARFENDTENPDFVTGQQFARVGLIENPDLFNSSSIFTDDKGSTSYAIKLTGVGYSEATFTPDSFVTQTVGLGSTAVGRVVAYEQITGVLKLWQDRSTAGYTTAGVGVTDPTYGFTMNRFTAGIATGGSYNIVPTTGNTLAIETSFTDNKVVINNRDYYLGQDFTLGVAQPEVQKYSGNIIHVDNRPSVTRSSSQKEDVKIILQF